MTCMKRVSVAHAKAHFSELIAEARRGKRIVILRHGKPAAAVVPANEVEPSAPPVRMSRKREGLPLVTFDAEILARAHMAGVTAVAP
jgi:prevent-host-death family protein